MPCEVCHGSIEVASDATSQTYELYVNKNDLIGYCKACYDKDTTTVPKEEGYEKRTWTNRRP